MNNYSIKTAYFFDLTGINPYETPDRREKHYRFQALLEMQENALHRKRVVVIWILI